MTESHARRGGVSLLIVGALLLLNSTTVSALVPDRSVQLSRTPPVMPTPIYFPTVGEQELLHSVAHHVLRPFAATTSNTLVNQGGINGVETAVGSPKVYLVFWGSQWGAESTTGTYPTFSGDPAGMAPDLEALFSGLGTNGELWSGVMTQYCNNVPAGTTTCPAGAQHISYPSSSVLAGVWYDNSQPAPSSATQSQISAEADSAAQHFGNVTSESNASAQYVVVSPTGTTPDGFPNNGFCAWHSYDSQVAYTNLPYIPDATQSCGADLVNGTAGALDGVTIVEGHEYAETLTDMSAGGGWLAPNNQGEENGDLCAWIAPGSPGGAANIVLATGTFPMQSTWSNLDNACVMGDPIAGGSPNLFSLSSSPLASMTAGTSTTVSISSLVTSGVAQTLTLSATGLPNGVSATFQPSSVVAGSADQVTLTSSATTTPGTYPLTITGTGATDSASTSLSVRVRPVPMLYVAKLSSSHVSLAPGSRHRLRLVTRLTSGRSQSIVVRVFGLPAGVRVLAPRVLTSGQSRDLTIIVGSATHPGHYRIRLTVRGPHHAVGLEEIIVVTPSTR